MTDSLSRYYDSIGRGKDAPFFDPKLNYAETEPDLTEPVNKAIDEQIKDTQAFFKASIEDFNASLKVRDQAFKDLASLTKDGIKMVKKYNEFKDNRNYLNTIYEKGSDNDYMTRFTLGNIDFKKEAALLDKDINVLIGEAKQSIERTGSYTFESDGRTIKFEKKDLTDFQLALEQGKGLTGDNAAKQALIMWDPFVEIAKSHLLHSETGLRFDQLTSPEDKLEWYYEMAAHYLGYVKKSNDRISDGDIIKHLLPTIKADMKNQFGSDKTVQSSASEKTLSDQVLYGGGQELLGMLNNSKNGTLDFDSVFDTKSGMIRNKMAGYKAEGFSDTEALERSLKDFEKIVEFAYKNLGLTREDYYRLVNEHKLSHSDGRTGLSYWQMGPQWAASVERMDTMLSKIDADRDKLTYENKFIGFKDRYKKYGTLMSNEEANEFIHTDIYGEVLQFKANIERNTTKGERDDKYSIDTIQNSVVSHVEDKKLGGANQLQTNRHIEYIKIVANEDYFRIKNELIAGNVDPADARAQALQKVSDNITDGVYDDALPNPKLEFDPGQVYLTNATVLDGADKETKEAWLNNTTAHPGELKYLAEGNYQIDFGGDGPALYKNLARFFPDLDWRGVMIRRLEAMKLAKPGEYEKFKSPLKGRVSSYDARKLTHNTTDAGVYFVLNNSAKNLQNLDEILLNRPISLNMAANGGEDAIFYETTADRDGYYENKNWSETDVIEVLEGLSGESDEVRAGKRYGIYGIRGDNLWKILTYMNNNNMLFAGRTFDKQFQQEIMLLNIALESQKKLTLNGDVSYLGMLPITNDEGKSYEEIFGNITDLDKAGEGNWNEVQYLLQYIGRYKIEQEMFSNNKKEETE
tara:strand:+ start:1940 stop:4522 length:2583 start_codon:yes stop_codon:yes gene_type:complete